MIVSTRGSRSSQRAAASNSSQLAAEEARRGNGKLERPGRTYRRELPEPYLLQPHGSVEVLQSVTSEIAERLVVEESCRGRRDDDLTAVRQCADPRASMDVDPDVPL